jgi:regulator of protease activity HflC (stomatin/prohibitin superfamily)
VLDEATGKWGIRVNRVELKSIDPPMSIQESMEKQMRADREKRAAILTAEGVKQSQILTAEGEKQSAILKAEGAAPVGDPDRPRARRRRSTPCSRRSTRANPDQKLLAYQYLQVLPQIAQGDANTIWMLPSELTQALGRIGGATTHEGGEEKT